MTFLSSLDSRLATNSLASQSLSVILWSSSCNGSREEATSAIPSLRLSSSSAIFFSVSTNLKARSYTALSFAIVIVSISFTLPPWFRYSHGFVGYWHWTELYTSNFQNFPVKENPLRNSRSQDWSAFSLLPILCMPTRTLQLISWSHVVRCTYWSPHLCVARRCDLGRWSQNLRCIECLSSELPCNDGLIT